MDRIEAYLDLLRAHAPRLDLVAPGDLDRLRERHVADSLVALDVVRSAPLGPCIDVGSGAGFPGIPLALSTPERRWRLLEPRRRRAAFLEEAVRALGLDCEVLVVRAEQAARDPRYAGTHAVATARALAPPPKAFELLLPLIAPGGVALVWVGETARVPPKATMRGSALASMRRALTDHPSD